MEQRTELKQKAELYLKAKTFVHIKEIHPSGLVKWYNGFILQLTEDFLILQDRKIIQPFPILYESIVSLEPSEQELQ